MEDLHDPDPRPQGGAPGGRTAVRRRGRRRARLHRRPDGRGRVQRRARSSPARATSGRASSSSRPGRVGVVRDGERDRHARSGRVLRRAVGPRRQPRTAQVVAAEPTICLALATWEFEAVVREQPTVALSRHARPGDAPARADRSAAPLSAARRSRRREHGPAARPTARDRHLPVQRHRGLDAARAGSRHRAVPATSSSAIGPCSGPRSPPTTATSRDRGRLVLRHLPERRRRRRRRRRRPARDGRRALARWRSMSESGWASTPVSSRRPRKGSSGTPSTGRPGSPAAAHGGQVLLGETTRALVAGELPVGRRAARPRRASAQGPPSPGTTGRARHRRPAQRLPAAALHRRPSQQPADPADDVRGPRARTRRGRSPPGADAPVDLHRPGRDRQDSPRPRGGRSGRRALPGRGVVRGPRDRPGGDPRGADHRARCWASSTAPAAPRSTASSRPSSIERMLLVLDNFEQVVAAGPVVAEILRRCPNVTALVTTRIALHVSGEQEYPVPGLPAPPDTSRLSEVERLNLPRALARVRRRGARPVRGGPPVHRPGQRRAARLRGDQRQRSGRRRHRCPPPRHAPGHRARRGPDQAPVAGSDPGPARPPSGGPDRRIARPAGAPADAARGDRLELRPPR